MSEQVLLVEHRPPVRILTLNRPQASNALNSQRLRELEREVKILRQERDILKKVVAIFSKPKR